MHSIRSSLFALLTGALFLLPQVSVAQRLSVGSVAAGTPQASPRPGGGIELTQSGSEAIEAGGVACAVTSGGYTVDNRYFRAFDLAETDVDTDTIRVTSVDMGIGTVALNGNGPVETALRFYAVSALNPDGSFPLSNATLLGTQPFFITEADSLSLVNIEINADIVLPLDEVFAFEWFTPSGDPRQTGNANPYDLRYGANDDGETGPTLLASAPCGIPDPRTLASLDNGTHNPPYAERQWVLFINGTLAAVANEGGATAQRVVLGTNFPNPVPAGITTVPFSLDAPQTVRLAVFDALGREVAASVGTFGAGEQAVQLDTRALPSGIYFYLLTAGEATRTRKMVVAQ